LVLTGKGRFNSSVLQWYNPRMLPAIFMDRDGVIIENRAEYVRSWQDVFIYPQALDALKQAAASPYSLIIVSNQAGIGKGIIPKNTADQINDRLLEVIRANGGRIDGIYICPHTAEDLCACRKPLPGLLLRAAQELSLDLSRSAMIGDALTDLAAGQSAGVAQSILVETGRGREQSRSAAAGKLNPFTVIPDLYSAIQLLIALK
jgi:D-glycero-D-manno-heptose 1,7-bisphosphate phosphatase